MLPARAAGPVDVDLQVIVVDRDVDLLGLGQHRDGRCAGVDTPAAFGNGDALDAVDAALEFELGADALPRNAGDLLLVTADVGLIRRDDFDLPALRIGLAPVHAEQVACRSEQHTSELQSPLHIPLAQVRICTNNR